MSRLIRVRVVRPCYIGGAPYAIDDIVEADVETACDAMMAGAAVFADAGQRSGLKVTPAVAWREPDADRTPYARIVPATPEQ
jgi:hypothetical protein